MQSSDIPGKLPKPFGANAGGDYIRSIPVNSQIGITDGAASLTDGFVPLNFVPIASGGVPPFGADMNGILFEITGWTRWAAAGGPIYFDGAFAALIGGYPKGAVVQSSSTPGVMFVSTAENNSTNPESGGANWISLSPVPATLAELRSGTDTTKYVTSATLAGLRAVLLDLTTGTDLAKYVTPKALADLRASGDEVRTGTDPAKYVSPLTLAGALSGLIAGATVNSGNTNAWFKLPVAGLPSPLILQMGRVNDGGSNPIQCPYPIPFTTIALAGGGIPFTYSNGGFSDQDGFIGLAYPPFLDHLQFAVSRRGGDQHVDGCCWWAVGY